MACDPYPTLVRRYLGAMIDGVVVILLAVAIGQLPFVPRGEEGSGIVVFMLVLLNYEPLLTALRCTAGQAVMRFRVRDAATQEQAPLWRLYLRVVIKALLGIVSFLTLPARRDRRAIHDLAARTLVVEASRVTGA